ncbi:hypothetical protein [Helicobacter cinaedi]|uniref:hypothetical protein n=1 Tax=Helicobacter cinaedi TaxID=213 RepID=UPI0014037A77|nr:hypothetical protein [Helicobacter cinaedi]
MPINVVPTASFLLLQTLVFSPTSLKAGEGLSLSIAPAPIKLIFIVSLALCLSKDR